MRITLNLATRPYADQGPMLKRLRISMAVMALILASCVLGMLHFHQRALAMSAQEKVIDDSIAKVEGEEQGYQQQMQQPANARVLTQAQFLNHLFEEKSFSWTAAMEDLERVLPRGEQVTAIEPSRGKDGRLTLRLRVSGMRERSVEMVKNMERSRRFLSPRISGENAENSSQGDLQPVKEIGRVSFDILAEYSPATLEERESAIASQKKGRPEKAKPVALPSVPTHSLPLRPQYVAPNPQPRQNPAARFAPAPQAGPEADVRSATQPNQLRNHDANRNRPLNSTIPNPDGGEPK